MLFPDPCFFFPKKARNHEKTKIVLPAESLNPWKRKEKHINKQGKSQSKESKENEKNKDWRIRVGKTIEKDIA